MADDCIFCNPAEGAELYRGDDGIVVMDDPIRDGHLMVGVVSHVTNLHDASPEEVSAMMGLAARVSASIVSATGAEKTYVAAIGDMDKHFHVHLLPKGPDDPNMGSHIFSGNGWAAFLPPAVETDRVAAVNAEVVAALGQ